MNNEHLHQSNLSIKDWAIPLFRDYLDHQEQIVRILHLSINGISMLRARQKAVKALGNYEGRTNDEDYLKQLENATKEKMLAQKEVDNNFPLLHEQAAVALWGSLEALVRTFVAGWLEHKADAMQAPDVRKLKICLGDYEDMAHSDRCFWIVDQIDQASRGPLKKGINRFEELLRPFGLSGPFDKKHTDTLFELSQIRHVIVHRSGVADLRLLKACPWLSYTKGERVQVSPQMWGRYCDAVTHYVVELINRTRKIDEV